jgi:hypothetical protein
VWKAEEANVCRYSCIFVLAIMPLLRSLQFCLFFFAMSPFDMMFVPLHHVARSCFAFCDLHYSVTPLPELIGLGDSVAVTVGRHFVFISIRQ